MQLPQHVQKLVRELDLQQVVICHSVYYNFHIDYGLERVKNGPLINSLEIVVSDSPKMKRDFLNSFRYKVGYTGLYWFFQI